MGSVKSSGKNKTSIKKNSGYFAIYFNRQFYCRISAIGAKSAIREFIKLNLPDNSAIALELEYVVRFNNGKIVRASRVKSNSIKKGVFEIYYGKRFVDRLTANSGKKAVEDFRDFNFTDKIVIDEDLALTVGLKSNALVQAVRIVE